MKLETFIAKRYFVSKHKLNFITVISLISTLGIMVGVASLIVVLSVFNGFGNLVESFLTSIDPDIRIDFIQNSNENFAKTDSLLKDSENIKSFSPYINSRVLLESRYAQSVSELKGIRIIGTAKEKIGVLSFHFENVHPHDIGTFLDFEGVAIRTGHHCTQPLMDRFHIPATSRASFAMYNTKEEVDTLVKGLKKILDVFK